MERAAGRTFSRLGEEGSLVLAQKIKCRHQGPWPPISFMAVRHQSVWGQALPE